MGHRVRVNTWVAFLFSNIGFLQPSHLPFREGQGLSLLESDETFALRVEFILEFDVIIIGSSTFWANAAFVGFFCKLGDCESSDCGGVFDVFFGDFIAGFCGFFIFHDHLFHIILGDVSAILDLIFHFLSLLTIFACRLQNEFISPLWTLRLTLALNMHGFSLLIPQLHNTLFILSRSSLRLPR